MFTPDLIHLRQLCRLEISGTQLASILFQDLKNVVACDALTLLWREHQAPVARMFHESETEVSCGAIDALSFEPLCSATNSGLFAVLTAEHPMLRTIARLLPGVNYFVEHAFQTLAVCFTGLGNCAGAMLLHRLRAQAFSTMEKAALVRLSPVISAGLSVNSVSSQLIASEGDAGILLLDRGMNIQYACCRGRKLIQLAQAPIGLVPHTSDGDLAHRLRINLDSAHSARAAKFVIHNSWGSFEFLLHRLSDTEINSDQLTAVAVHRQEPLALSVFRGCQKLALTEKQTEIALLLIKGLSNDQVATKICISVTTVADHVRKIYDKVGASNRSELVTTLLLGEKNCTRVWPPQESSDEYRLSTIKSLRVHERTKGMLHGNAL